MNRIAIKDEPFAPGTADFTEYTCELSIPVGDDRTNVYVLYAIEDTKGTECPISNKEHPMTMSHPAAHPFIA